MKTLAISMALVAGLLLGNESTEKAAAARAASAPVFHCQVPCGIYGDQMRIAMMMEDAATIEKGMTVMAELAGTTPVNYNQIVRWTVTKDQHAASIQEQVASYWLAQRIKAPQDSTDASGTAKYLNQLRLMHGITVAAMKCKQTTESTWVEAIRGLAKEFAATYFSEADLKHMREHHDGEKH